MMKPSTTIRVFAWYLFALAAVLLVVPNQFLGAFGMPQATDVWVRVTGMLVGFLGYYYLRASAAGLEAFFAWTVPVRLSVLLFFGAFVALDYAPPILLLFGVVDALAAGWTWWVLRGAAATA